jgi:hypothetical protein
MTAEQLTTILTNLLTTGGIAIFVFYLVRGLKREIASLNKTIEAQNKTLEVMEKRISETERVGDIYKGLIDELPAYVEKYKEVLRVTKDAVIIELEKANQAKDEKLKETKELDLRRLELQEQMLAELPKLREDLVNTTNAMQTKLEAMEPPLTKNIRRLRIKTFTARMGGRVEWERTDRSDFDNDNIVLLPIGQLNQQVPEPFINTGENTNEEEEHSPDKEE